MKPIIRSIICFLTAQSLLADQASYENERLYILEKAKKYPLLQAELLKKHGMYKRSAEIITKLINNATPLGEVDELGNFLVKTGPLQATPLDYLYYSRASCLDELKQHDKALRDYIKSHKLDPDPNLLYEIAHTHYELKMVDEAILAFNKYLQTAKPDRQAEYLARYFRVICAFGRGSRSWGFQELNAMKNEFPEHATSTQHLIDQADDKKATELSQESTNSSPTTLVE